MNRLNPLHILVTLLLITMFSFYLISNKKQIIKEEAKQKNLFKEQVFLYKDLKKSWYNQKEVRKQINFILNDSKLSNMNVSKKFEKTSVKITLNFGNKKMVNYFVNKLLNKKLRIKNLSITSTQVFVEVALR